MSRTKGVNSAVRHKHDEYITAPWCVKRFMEKYPIPQGQTILDPCASRGELLVEIKRLRPDLTVAGIEINPERAEALSTAIGADYAACPRDFLTIQPTVCSPGRQTITVVTNPPYPLTREFVEHSLKFAQVACFLLRLNFLGGRDRREFTERSNPGIFVLPNRPCWDGHGSDACEYGWFVYGDPSVAGRWCVLDKTPAEEIAAWSKLMRARYPKVPVEVAMAAAETSFLEEAFEAGEAVS